MRELTVGLVQMDISLGQVKANIRRAEQQVEKAALAGVNLLILPELWNTGYALTEIHELAELLEGPTAQTISTWAKEYNMAIIGGSIALASPQGVTNTTLVFDQYGKLISQYSKIHLFKLMEEDRYLAAGNQVVTTDIFGWRCGLMICYDLRFPELARSLVDQGTEILIVPAEFPHPRKDHWRTLLRARAIENQTYVLGVNRVGKDAKNHFFGHSMIINPWGQVVEEGSEDELLIVGTLHKSALSEVRTKIPSWSDRKPEIY